MFKKARFIFCFYRRTLIAKVYGNGDDVICQAYSSLKVGVPSSAILNVQSEQLAVGRETPIYPLFSEGDLFSFYGLCKDYEWTIENEEVLTFGVPLVGSEAVQRFNYVDKEKLSFINVLYGRYTSINENYRHLSFMETHHHHVIYLLLHVTNKL
ncbi:nuclear pore complex protein GP210-like [Hibiscus syriacus]|uniref:nuclear pore complex protein GP210-like n=1 Tax=Hibiscus syriacus TaxID=106335 RepID=UPI001922692F|nr:nuclear pore complex protein GP210-like [Hibiscus syriacus]